MNLWVRPLRAWSTTPGGRKTIRYLLVSVMNVALGQVVLVLGYLILRWSAPVAAVVAVVVTTIPAYFLNRMWVWGRSGRSHLVKEVIPFWVTAFVYLALFVGAAAGAEAVATNLTTSRVLKSLIIMAAIVVASAVLWLVRYFVLDTLIFSGPGGVPEVPDVRPAGPFAPKAVDARS